MKHTIPKLDAHLNWRWLNEIASLTLERALAIQAIPAPTFAEGARAQWVADAFRAEGLEAVEIDGMYNVRGLLRGDNPSLPGIMISAHTDTIFSAGTDLTTRREGDLIFGPGLGDNSVGVGALFGLLTALRKAEVPLKRDLWFVATTREEGLGDLGGMRAAYQALADKIDSVINLEGLAFGHVYHAGIAVRRLHITAQTPGGHSWLHFGKPSAVHVIAQLANRITQIRPPIEPRTTYNIGMIEGGDAINAIATHAGLWLDMRSESRGALEHLEAQVRLAIQHTEQADVTISAEVVGDRPAGSIAPDHALVQAALAALQQVGTRGTLEVGSTDGNVPLSEGCPTVTVGITRGGNAHRLDEFIEIQPIALGMRQLILLTLAAATSETSISKGT